ncbi:hypothetical protein BLA9940_04454 [Burkholderia aenigmatica]|uniref:hypothetical protein n=1 Tax=Burkholderia aenigmatica TaxID=2015348 RepID=UPI0014533F26|nr:hypothetical protein [Burkholderia aenigmatica]VWC75949.1 hypothetical protein BLA9940_04454 [Burkholderia aenigmatica]
MNEEIKSQKDQLTKNLEFFEFMTAIGKTPRIATPSYADFIQILTSIFDQKSDENKQTRSDKLSESRSMHRKQSVYESLITKLLSTWGINKEHQKPLRIALQKIENILSHLKSITICSVYVREYGDGVFFRDIALPQTIEILHFLSKSEDAEFWKEMHDYFTDLVLANKSTRDCITKLRNEAKNLLDSHQEDLHRTSEFRTWLDKLDTRSFPKMDSIDVSLSRLRDDPLNKNQLSDTADELIAKLRYKFLAAKASFYALKFISENEYSQPYPLNSELTNAHSRVCTDYIFKSSEEESSIPIDIDAELSAHPGFNLLKENFLTSIGYISLEQIPSEISRTPLNLIAYRDGVLLPWCAHEKFIWDLTKGNIDEAYISGFEEMFLATTKSYQYGSLGATLATLLLGMKIKTSEFIPHQALEPVVMAELKNSADSIEPHHIFSTPFGESDPVFLRRPDFNIARGVGQFNRLISANNFNQTRCNPLERIDDILKLILSTTADDGSKAEEVRLPTALRKRPIKYSDMSIYDALKNLNELLHLCDLVETERLDTNGTTYVEESLAGQYINEYLVLSNSEKREILKRISPEDYKIDMDKMQPLAEKP